MSLCSACGAEVALANVFPGGTTKCASCGATVTVPEVADDLSPPMPELAPAAAPAVLCPRCNAALEPREADGSFVDVCPKHHGVFVAHDALEGLRAEGPAAVADLEGMTPATETEARYVDCPRCHHPMARRTFAPGSGVIVDICAVHGTWFDGAELREVLATSAPGEAPEPADPLAQERAKLEVSLAYEADREAKQVERVAQALDSRLYWTLRGRRGRYGPW